jgi:hypothetical protein
MEILKSVDLVVAWVLGEIAVEVGQQRQGIGDPIDRGLILRRRLEEEGFGLVKLSQYNGEKTNE